VVRKRDVCCGRGNGVVWAREAARRQVRHIILDVCVWVWAFNSIFRFARTGQKFEMQREGCRGVSPIPDRARGILALVSTHCHVLGLENVMNGA
jgi:hypothetical protein